MKKVSVIQWLAWFFALNFLFIVTVSHWPGLTDSQGRLLGLFYIDPIDDIFHLFSGLIAAVVALHSRKASVWYFKIAGIPYGLDALGGLFFSREVLNGEIFTQGLGAADFSLNNWLVQLPHIIILVASLWIAFWLSNHSDKNHKGAR